MNNDYRLERAFDTSSDFDPSERFNDRTVDAQRLQFEGQMTVALGAAPTEFARKQREPLKTQSDPSADTLK